MSAKSWRRRERSGCNIEMKVWVAPLHAFNIRCVLTCTQERYAAVVEKVRRPGGGCWASSSVMLVNRSAVLLMLDHSGLRKKTTCQPHLPKHSREHKPQSKTVNMLRKLAEWMISKFERPYPLNLATFVKLLPKSHSSPQSHASESRVLQQRANHKIGWTKSNAVRKIKGVFECQPFARNYISLLHSTDVLSRELAVFSDKLARTVVWASDRCFYRKLVQPRTTTTVYQTKPD